MHVHNNADSRFFCVAHRAFFAPNPTFGLDFREHANPDSCDRMGCIPANSSLPRADLSLASRHRQHGPSNAKPSHHSRHPPAPKLIVLPPKPQIGFPAHPGWLRWELPLALGGALPLVVQPVRDAVGAMHSTLRGGLIP